MRFWSQELLRQLMVNFEKMTLHRSATFEPSKTQNQTELLWKDDKITIFLKKVFFNPIFTQYILNFNNFKLKFLIWSPNITSVIMNIFSQIFHRKL